MLWHTGTYHRHRLPYLSTQPDEPFWLVSCYFSFPHNHHRSPYLSRNPDEPKRLGWCSFCFPLSPGIVIALITSPHTQTSQRGSSGVLFAFHTALVARLTSPHTQTSLIGLSGVPLLSTHLIARLTSPHTQRSLIGSSSILFALYAALVARLTSPYTQSSLIGSSGVLLLSTQPDEPTWLIWRHQRLPYLSTHTDEP